MRGGQAGELQCAPVDDGGRWTRKKVRVSQVAKCSEDAHTVVREKDDSLTAEEAIMALGWLRRREDLVAGICSMGQGREREKGADGRARLLSVMVRCEMC